MLSIVDLIEAGTMTREMAAYSLAAVGNGASFMVGALPGGAGKTTVMGALLNLVPTDVQLRPADGMAAIDQGLRCETPRCCYICHEIGNGPYYAYLWGQALRRYFELPTAGHMMATNLHADTYAQAREQVCGENDVPTEHFVRMNLLYFLSVEGSAWNGRRRINAIWESDGTQEYRQMFSGDAGESACPPSELVSAEDMAVARDAIDGLLASGVRTIEEVRSWLIDRSKT